MQHPFRIAALLLATLILVPTTAWASEASDQCSEAWLSSDWAKVAVRCATSSRENETEAVQKMSDADSAASTNSLPPNLIAMGRKIAAMDFLLAALDKMKSLVAYHKLKHDAAAEAETSQVQFLVDHGKKYAEPGSSEEQELNQLSDTLAKSKWYAQPLSKMPFLN